MNSSGYPHSDQVLGELGDHFVHAFIDAVDGARDDFDAFKEWQPGWFPSFTGRFTANFLHERIWDRLVRDVSGIDGIHVNDREPIRELRNGTTYLIRIKRHHPGDRISAYPTEASNFTVSPVTPPASRGHRLPQTCPRSTSVASSARPRRSLVREP